MGPIWASSPMGPPFSSFGCDSLAENDFWSGRSRNSPASSSLTPLRHAQVLGDGRAMLAWAEHSLRPAATLALAALGASLSPRVREIRTCRAQAPGEHLPLRCLGQGQTGGCPGNWDCKATATALCCCPKRSCLLHSAESVGSKCWEQLLSGARSQGRHWPENQEWLQCWEIRCRGGWLQLAELVWPSPPCSPCPWAPTYGAEGARGHRGGQEDTVPGVVGPQCQRSPAKASPLLRV